MSSRRLMVVFGALLFTAAAALAAPGGAMHWRTLDGNHDGKFDRSDINLIVKDGLWHPSMDVNGDGKRDMADVFAMELLLTTGDRTGDGAVTADDFILPPPLTLPEPDASAAATLITAALAEAAPNVPPGQETTLMQQWPQYATADDAVRAALWDEAGALALTVRNVDVAQWALAKACALNPQRASALSNLGFILSQRNRPANALVLLAQARKVGPATAPASNNLGWVFARNGQLDEADRYYAEAIARAPDVGQYHLNRGAVLLRKSDTAGAAREFTQACALAPGDREALMMSVAVTPAPSVDASQYEPGYQQYQAEIMKEDPDAGGPAWADLRPSDKLQEILRQQQVVFRKQRDEALKALADETSQAVIAAVSAVAPQGTSAVNDWKQYWGGVAAAQYQLAALRISSRKRAGDIENQHKRRIWANKLSNDRLILQFALADAQAKMAACRGSAADARNVFNKTIASEYDGPMRQALQNLNSVPGSSERRVDLSPEAASLESGLYLMWMAIIGGAAGDPEHYGKGFFDKGPPAGVLARIKLAQEDPTFGASIGIVGLEWSPEDNAWKLQVGQGIIVAGTWSPTSGFGFQVGAGVSITEGPWKASAATYVKFGSDGSISVVDKAGAGMSGPNLGTKLGGSLSTQICGASHEPVGTL
jgi:Tfp pilus assembly protein PilF